MTAHASTNDDPTTQPLPPRSHWRTLRPIRLQPHHTSTATLASAYPFLATAPTQVGLLIGWDALTGAPFCFDPWAAYEAGTVTNPNMLLAGVIGQGKSSLAKALALRSIAAGRRVYVPGDPKGEWAPIADAVGGQVIRLGPGLPTRLNPLDLTASPTGRARSLATLAAIAATLLARDLRPVEHAALDHAHASATNRGTGTLDAVVAALANPPARGDAHLTREELAAAGRDLLFALRRLTHGDLDGMFNGPSTHRFDPDRPMLVLDLSALGADDTALAIAATCAAAWLESALATTDSRAKRWVIYDEAWRLMRSAPLVARMQAQWKLSRAHGIANLLILHRLSDLDAIGDATSGLRALASGLLADCSTRVIYRQEADQLAATVEALGLTDTERDLLPVLPRGTGLWKVGQHAHVVHHRLHIDELDLVDTDAAMRDHHQPRPDTGDGGAW